MQAVGACPRTTRSGWRPRRPLVAVSPCVPSSVPRASAIVRCPKPIRIPIHQRPTMPTDNLTIARQFAEALDRDDFDAARDLLHENVVYDAPNGRLDSRDAVIDSYARNARWARRAFDELTFRSDVQMLATDRAEILYTDETMHRGVHHIYQCRQIITFDDTGRISHIEHREIPGEKEKLEAFLDRVGVKREG